MAGHSVSISIPEELVAEIDAEVGPDSRLSFVLETARAELRRRKLRAFLSNDDPVWKDEDHPELAAMGTYGYVRQLRSEWSKRPALDPSPMEEDE